MSKFIFNTENVAWTQAMEIYTQEAIEKGLKRINDLDTTFTIKVSIVNKKPKLIKVEISFDGFRAQSTGKDFYITINSVVTKLKGLFLKDKKKHINKKRRVKTFEEAEAALSEVESELNKNIFKEKLFILDPCTLDSALKQFEQTDYNFYVFKDVDEQNNIAILYRRFDKTIGIIRCK